MSNANRNDLLKKLLLSGGHKARLWAAVGALCIGTVLLLFSVLIWWNFRELLYGKKQNDSLGATFLVIGKKVTQENMGDPKATVYSKEEIDSVKIAPQVQDAGIITANRFPAYVVMGGRLELATELPLESVPDHFIDNLPQEWKWTPGSTDLPIIVSSQFLDIYNYKFAPGQGLPQLSEASVKAIGLRLKVGGDNGETFIAHVVGFSDRISSVLAPQSFIDYGNEKYSKQGMNAAPSQLIIKAGDLSDLKFVSFLQRHNYTTNTENLRWSRVRAIAEVVSAATGILAILLLGIGALVFVLFIELTISRSRQSITLLQQIGYSAGDISGFMTKRFLPLIAIAGCTSMLLAAAGQYIACKEAATQNLVLPVLPGLPVLLALLASMTLLTWLVVRAIRRAVKGE